MAIAIIDTGKTTSVVVDGNVVTKKVYEKIEIVEKKIEVNSADLLRRKAILEVELADINSMLKDIDSLEKPK